MRTVREWRVAGWCLVVIVISLCAGCMTTQDSATLQGITMLHERVQTMERRLDGMDTQGPKSADLSARLEELQMRVGALNGRIEELDYRVQQLSRAAASPPPAAQTPATPSLTIPATPPASPPAASPPPASPAQPSAAKTASPQPNISIPEKESPEKTLFDRASQLQQQGQLEAARKEYQALISKYPKSEFSDNALYALGEIYFSEKRYQDSIESLQQLLDRYPNGNRVPHALLKQAAAFQQLGDTTAARILYERLVENYPDSPQAQAAEKKLKQM